MVHAAPDPKLPSRSVQQRACQEGHSRTPTHVSPLQDVSARVDNEAVLQLQVTKASNQFLSTLAAPGEAQFLTVLKPCSILLPHVHQRANEFYSVIFGTPS